MAIHFFLSPGSRNPQSTTHLNQDHLLLGLTMLYIIGNSMKVNIRLFSLLRLIPLSAYLKRYERSNLFILIQGHDPCRGLPEYLLSDEILRPMILIISLIFTFLLSW